MYVKEGPQGERERAMEAGKAEAKDVGAVVEEGLRGSVCVCRYVYACVCVCVYMYVGMYVKEGPQGERERAMEAGKAEAKDVGGRGFAWECVCM
jgi:hypothetical protein